MKKLHFDIEINAPREKVWSKLVNDKPYREWTSAFYPGSYFEGKWEKGEKMLFLALNKKGQLEGMTSMIAESRPFEYISIKHLGYVKDGIEDTESDEIKKWAPAFEDYTLSQVGEGTRFNADIDIEDFYEEMFNTMWPAALKKLKEISER